MAVPQKQIVLGSLCRVGKKNDSRGIDEGHFAVCTQVITMPYRSPSRRYLPTVCARLLQTVLRMDQEGRFGRGL